VWFFLFILALVALAGLHFWWRAKFNAQAERRASEIEASQRKQQQTSLDAKAQQQVLFNSMLEGLLLLDRSRKIYLVNRAFKNLFGLKTELRGKTIVEALRLHELDELIQRVEAEQQVLDYEIKLPDLNERWLQVNAAVITNAAGERDGTILVFRDLTRLKQLERTREEFVANVSHELRTPLSLIKGYVETLLDGARDNPEVAERFLKIIERKPDAGGVGGLGDLRLGETRVGLQLERHGRPDLSARDAGEGRHRAGLTASAAELGQQRARVEGIKRKPDHPSTPLSAAHGREEGHFRRRIQRRITPHDQLVQCHLNPLTAEGLAQAGIVGRQPLAQGRERRRLHRPLAPTRDIAQSAEQQDAGHRSASRGRHVPRHRRR
jgi:PAS domain S-box-containing protein